MRLDEYQWSRNPRGLHNKAAPFRMDINRLRAADYGWCKMVAIGTEYVDDIRPMLEANITPIIRIFRHNWGAGIPEPDMIEAWKRYINVGVRWFELYNEPNLGNEWPNGVVSNPADTQNIIKPLMDNWLVWAEMMIGMGCYPAFPALAEAVGDFVDVTTWLQAMLNYLAEFQAERFRVVVNNGLWVATHPYFYNHFYQEGIDALTPRAPDAVRSFEAGWHFEYPYDPLSQFHRPGLTAVSGDAEFPRGDPIGLTGMGWAFMTKLEEMFGGGMIPVVGTEGGITPVPTDQSSTIQVDDRYPPVTWFSHSEATLACFNWLANQAPPWMFGLTLWKEDDYYEQPVGRLRAVDLMEQFPAQTKLVQPIDALGGSGASAMLTGPGPVHGVPSYHFVLLAPGFNAEWYFTAARSYVDRYRPALIGASDYIAYLPYYKSLALTVLATPDSAEFTSQQIKDRFPNVQLDLVTVSAEDQLAALLNQRVREDKQFG